MATITPTKMTSSQIRAFHGMLGALGYEKTDKSKIINYFSEGRFLHCSDMDYIDAQNMLRKMRELLQSSEKSRDLGANNEKLDRLRKGCMKAIFSWYELRNQKVSIDYVKATMCRASSRTDINQMTESELTRVYNEFCRKQTIIKNSQHSDFSINLN